MFDTALSTQSIRWIPLTVTDEPFAQQLLSIINFFCLYLFKEAVQDKTWQVGKCHVQNGPLNEWATSRQTEVTVLHHTLQMTLWNYNHDSPLMKSHRRNETNYELCHRSPLTALHSWSTSGYPGLYLDVVYTIFRNFGPPPPCLHSGQIHSTKSMQPPFLRMHLGNPYPLSVSTSFK